MVPPINDSIAALSEKLTALESKPEQDDPEDAMAVAEVQELLAGSEQYFKTTRRTRLTPSGQAPETDVQASDQVSTLEP
jgi:hypothetical protein